MRVTDVTHLLARTQVGGTFDMFLHILQLVSTCETGIHAIGTCLCGPSSPCNRYVSLWPIKPLQ